MKRIALLWVVVLLLTFSVAIVVLLKSPDPNAPQFKRLQSLPGSQEISFDFLASRPFEGGKMCISRGPVGTNREPLLFDIEKRQVLGRVTNGWPVMLLGDPPRLLCAQKTVARNGMKERLQKLLERISQGRIKFPSPQREVVRYWLLDPEKHAAIKIGDLPGTPNFSFFPSPDYHYTYTGRHNDSGGVDFFYIDLKQGFIKKFDTPGWASGWWDNAHILFQTTNGGFLLYDVQTKATSSLISFDQIEAFWKAQRISEKAANPRAFFIWNGRENDFYLTDAHQKWFAAESFLIKVERPGAKLTLLSPSFKFEWSDHLDPTGRYYLYSGREAGDSSDGVFVRDLRNGTTNILVAPTSSKYFSIPRFYRDSVIYIRSNALWRINLDGSNNTKLFPPQ